MSHIGSRFCRGLGGWRGMERSRPVGRARLLPESVIGAAPVLTAARTRATVLLRARRRRLTSPSRTSQPYRGWVYPGREGGPGAGVNEERQMARWDDIEILQTIDRLQEQMDGRPLWQSGYELAKNSTWPTKPASSVCG